MMQMTINLSGLFISLSYFAISGFGMYFEESVQKPYIYLVVLFVLVFPFLRHSFNIYVEVLKDNKHQYKLIQQCN